LQGQHHQQGQNKSEPFHVRSPVWVELQVSANSGESGDSPISGDRLGA